MHYVFVELPKFDKTENELITELDKWIYLFKYLPHLTSLPKQLNQPIFQKIMQIAEINNLTKEERMLFDRELKNRMDYEASIRYEARINREEGLEQGREEGLEQGRREAKLLIAKKLINRGMPISEVAKITGLSPKILKPV